MKNSTAAALLPFLLVLGGAVHAACVYPQPPQSLPNGTTSSEEQMKAANAQVVAYRNEVQDTYLPCLAKEKDDAIAALDNMDPEYTNKKATIEAIHAKRHNAAIDELTALATRWNGEIKAFKEKDKPKK